MKMTFNYYIKLSSILISASLCSLSLFSITPICADESVKNIEKNVKVESAELSLVDEHNLGDQDTSLWQLKAEQWELNRDGESLLALPVLNKVVNAWLKERQQKIEIQYPGGEDGEFWVQQLTDWLVSLGIPSKKMMMVPGSGADDVIRFNLIK